MLEYKIFVRGISIFISALLLFCIYLNDSFTLFKDMSFAPPYNASIQCLDDLESQYQFKNGLADYWNVRSVRMLSKNAIQTTQIDNQLNFINLADNKLHFYANYAKKSPNDYQFIIVNNLSKDKISHEIGKPDTIIFCPNKEIWIYLSKQNSTKLNHYFAKKLAYLR